MDKTVIIIGSSRKKGNTYKLAELIANEAGAEIIELIDYNISYYDYESRNLNDDFFGIIEKILTAEKVVFATPVYWYSMSGVLKTFIDRFSDLITIRKNIGRSLAGKKIYLLTCGSHGTPSDGIEQPIKGMAGYMDMNFGGYLHGWANKQGEIPEDVREDVENFAKEIRK